MNSLASDDHDISEISDSLDRDMPLTNLRSLRAKVREPGPSPVSPPDVGSGLGSRPGTGSRDIIDRDITDIGLRPLETGEREPGPTPSSSSDVGTDERLERPGPRVRYVAERGGGGNGTAYNKFDYMVLDRQAMAGRQLLCRTSLTGARLICYALNSVLR